MLALVRRFGWAVGSMAGASGSVSWSWLAVGAAVIRRDATRLPACKIVGDHVARLRSLVGIEGNEGAVNGQQR